MTQAFLNLPTKVQGRRCKVYIRFSKERRGDQVLVIKHGEAVISEDLDPDGIEEVRRVAHERLAAEGELEGRIVVVIERQAQTGAEARRFP